MAKDDMDTGFCPTIDFQFAEPWDSKKFFAKSQDIADKSGPEAAKRFQLVLSLGERVQERKEQSDRTLANVFNFVMDQIVKEERLDPVERAHLTDAFIKYSVYGHQLDVELKIRLEQRQQIRDMVQTFGTLPHYDFTDDDVHPDPLDDRSNISQVHYSFSREAGPG